MISSLLGGKQTSSPLAFGAGGAPTLSQSSVTSAGTSGLNFGGTTKTPGLTIGGVVPAQPAGLSVDTTTSTTKTATGGLTFPGASGGTSSAASVTLVGNSGSTVNNKKPMLVGYGFYDECQV